MTAKWQYKQAYEIALEEARNLEAENERLRELVRELLPCYLWSDCYGKCVNEDSKYASCPKHNLQKIASELGIEVTLHDRD